MDADRFEAFRSEILAMPRAQLHAIFNDQELAKKLIRGLSASQQQQLLVATNVKIFGNINKYVKDFLEKSVPRLAALPENFEKERIKSSQRGFIEVMLTYDDLSAENREKLQKVLHTTLSTAPAAGGKRKWKMPRKMTRRYCKKTSCRKMGFTQKASCRPWKNCY